ncbi:MAG: alpha/beta hydrolase [Gaiellaceae bacterium]|jgi:pimeloyl-ACP methyl ester carboxylesterase
MECTVRDITFAYEDIGTGMPAVMLHGWPLDHRHMLNALEPVFAQRPGWRRLYPDLPGMGRTRAADWIETHDQMLELVIELVDRLIPDERFVVAGVSYGGWLARGLVHDRADQIAGVLLSVPVVAGDAKDRILPKHRVRLEDADYLNALQAGEDGSREMIVAQSVDVLESWRRAISPALELADYDFLERLGGNYAFSFDPDDLSQPFEAPALIVTGRFDHICGYREAFDLLDRYPFATYAALDWAGHALPDERRALYRALVSDWLERVEAHERGRNEI